MILGDWLVQASSRLERAGIESSRLEAQLLAAHVLISDRSWIVAHPEIEFNDLAGEAVLQRRENREPLAYILGWREFFGRRFAVRPCVLIPRQETETLVSTALEIGGDSPVLDVGTGSGCIAITLKLEHPEWEVWATDVSEEALDMAQENSQTLDAEIRFVHSDSFGNLRDQRFALIVSNPPYIAESEALMPEVGGHEPHGALFAGPTGLEFYERLAVEAPHHLVLRGQLALEVGHTQATAVANILKRFGWTDIRTIRDLSGIDRVVVATCPTKTSLP